MFRGARPTRSAAPTPRPFAHTSVRPRVRTSASAHTSALVSALVLSLAVASLLTGSTTAASVAAAPAPPPAVPAAISPWDWPSFGHDAQHTFHGRTTLTLKSVTTLRPAWFFPTGDSVTATPTVVGDTVYVGSWDDWFYAVDFTTGKLRWKVRLKSQDGVTPYPGQHPRDTSSDGGLVTSSAWFQPAAPAAHRPALVILSGGYTLYALNAATGAVYWEHDYPGTPGRPDPDDNSTRIFSSPVVADGRVLFGVDEDGQPHSGGSIVAASLATGDPVWEFRTDVSRSGGPMLYDSCGSVWSSGTVLPDSGLVVFGTADCDFTGVAPFADAMLALHIKNGALAWKFRPRVTDLPCDQDLGASANAGVTRAGVTTFLGEGGKNGTYYSVDPRTGHLRWATNVVFGGTSGGFVGTTAFDGHRVYGATAIGDFLPSKSTLRPVCDPADPRDTNTQNPTDHAFDAATGHVRWQVNGTASFSATTVAGGMAFDGLALAATAIDVRATATGRLIARVPLAQFNWSGIATVGDALVIGLGSTEGGKSVGIEALTPHGDPPVVPRSR
jgi:outer membrane protein assembly factor BamB